MTAYRPRWRSLLYVPVTSERFVAKAHERGADAIILDLEDAVAPSEKERARERVPEAAERVGQSGADVLVRVNRPWRLAVRDLEAAIGPHVRGLVLPKADSADHVSALAEVVASVEEERGLPPGHTVLFPRVETPTGVLNAAEICRASPRVVAVGLGSSDYTIATGMDAGGPGNAMASFVVVNAAYAAGIVPLGLRGAPCVHPSQVPILNEVFSPTPAELERARRIVEEYERALAEGQGAITVDGDFVDIPFYEQAKRLLAQQ